MAESGKIYDVNALDRIKGYISQQQEQFEAAQNEKDKKELIVIAAVSVFSAIAMLFLFKKLVK